MFRFLGKIKTKNIKSIANFMNVMTGLVITSVVGVSSLESSALGTEAGRSATLLQTETQPEWAKHLGLTYFTFFDGPGLVPGSNDISPNVLGKPVDDGLRLSNFISLKYKLNSEIAIDFQMRIQWVLDNARGVDSFHAIRWQSPRIGISGPLLSGEDWSLTGAANTDLPYFFPQPFGGGRVAQQRTTLFTPGLFAGLTYKPKASHWSFFSLVMPRFFIYENRAVAEPQLSRAGFSPNFKNEFIFDISPSLNYALSHSTGFRIGAEFIYSKLIHSNWNPFHGNLNLTDTESKAWKLAAVPLQIGLTHEWSESLKVSIYMQGFPIAAQRVTSARTQVSFLETTSVGMWLSGTVI